MKIAVSAASGRLGHAILRRLGQRQLDVVAIARDPGRLRVAGVERRQGDYGDASSMQAALAGVDSLVMISAPVAGATDRVALHRNVLAAARSAGVRHVVFTSVIGDERAADTWFGPTWRVNQQTEQDLRESGLEWTVARNGLYLDLDIIQIRNAAVGGVYTNPAGDGRCGYISIEELATPFVALATEERLRGHTWNLTGESHTQAELVKMANCVFGLDVRYEVISDEAMEQKLLRLMPHRGPAVARMLTGAFQCIRNGAYDVPSHYADVTGRPAKPALVMMENLKQALPVG
jgi:NAD(P)H dehydrogenase (quinone)